MLGGFVCRDPPLSLRSEVKPDQICDCYIECHFSFTLHNTVGKIDVLFDQSKTTFVNIWIDCCSILAQPKTLAGVRLI